MLIKYFYANIIKVEKSRPATISHPKSVFVTLELSPDVAANLQVLTAQSIKLTLFEPGI